MYILSFIRNDLEKQTITEVPKSPECRLAICLYQLGQGDYYYTISEMVGVATVCQIVIPSNIDRRLVPYTRDARRTKSRIEFIYLYI